MNTVIRRGWLLALYFAGSFNAVAAEWPVFQQNDQRNAKTVETLDTGRLSVAWRRRLPGPVNPAWSGPAKWDAYAGLRGLKSMRSYDAAYHFSCVGERVWLGSTVTDAVSCLSLSDGRTVWDFHTDGPVRAAPSYADGRIYFGSDDGYVYCVREDTGELLWRFCPHPTDRRILNNGRLVSMWPVRTGVLVHDGIAYFGASLLPWEPSYLCALDAETGSRDRSGCFVTELAGATLEGPLSMSPGRFLVSPQGRVAPRLFSLEDGRSMGQLKGGGGSFVVLTKDSVFHGPGNKTGWLTASSWETLDTVASYRHGNAMVVAGDVSFILTDDALSAANYVTREELWSSQSDCSLAMILAGDRLFVGGEDQVRAFDARNGQPVWRATVEGKVFALAAANHHLLVGTDEGFVAAFTDTIPSQDSRVEKLALSLSRSDDSVHADLRPIDPERDPTMKDRWVFQFPHVKSSRVDNLAGGNPLAAGSDLSLARIRQLQALQNDSSGECLVVSDQIDLDDLPREQLTASAWVCIDQPVARGGIVGCVQNNGDYQQGWCLGYEDDSFTFAVSGDDTENATLTYVKDSASLRLGSWYHVAGVYDGETSRLYVNGDEVASTNEQKGAITYPLKGMYVVGGYRDEDEQNALMGFVHEVRVYCRALTAEEIERQFRSMAEAFPESTVDREFASHFVSLARGPVLRFVEPRTADITYQTREPIASQLTLYSQGMVVQKVDTEFGRDHRVRLAGLKHNRSYTYDIRFLNDAQLRRTREYECDTGFDFSIPSFSEDDEAVPDEADNVGYAFWYNRARDLVQQVGQRRGICVCLGCDDGQLIEPIVRQSEWRVIVFDEDEKRVRQLRQKLQKTGMYGVRVTAHHVPSLERLPVTSRFANVVVSESVAAGDAFPSTHGEIRRLLCPKGIAVLGGTQAIVARLPAKLRQLSGVQNQPEWVSIHGAPIPGAGVWSHIYGSADNSHYGGEALSSVRAADDLVVQWLGRPGARYQADRNGRKPPPLAAGGRLFLQGLHRILALDQYNGTILWSIEVPQVDRYNMPRDCGNWCCDEQAVYLAVEGQCWKLSADSGQLLDVMDVTTPTGNEQKFDWGYIAREHDLLIGSAVRRGTMWGTFWGKDAWYDADDGTAADKVASDVVFAREVGTNKPRWRYESGAIVNSTITIGDGTVYFVESRGEHLLNSGRRLGGKPFWENQFLVALDAQTGRVCWERPLDVEHGTVAFYASFGEGKLIVVSSTKRKYFVYAIQGKTGDDIWNAQIPWGKGKADHGSHLSRPAIVGRRVFVRPGVFDLETGRQLTQEIPVGGCGTYACTDEALFFRAGSGKNSAIWSMEDGRYTGWDRLRPDCWLSTIPAGGMLLSPEGGGGCSCGSWLETSLGFLPRVALTLD